MSIKPLTLFSKRFTIYFRPYLQDGQSMHCTTIHGIVIIQVDTAHPTRKGHDAKRNNRLGEECFNAQMNLKLAKLEKLRWCLRTGITSGSIELKAHRAGYDGNFILSSLFVVHHSPVDGGSVGAAFTRRWLAGRSIKTTVGRWV